MFIARWQKLNLLVVDWAQLESVAYLVGLIILVDCNCHECLTGEEDVFSFGECQVRQSDLELRRPKADMGTSGINVLVYALAVSISVFFVFFAGFHFIHQLK